MILLWIEQGNIPPTLKSNHRAYGSAHVCVLKIRNKQGNFAAPLGFENHEGTEMGLIDSDEDNLICKKFGYIHSRLLLYRQDSSLKLSVKYVPLII